MNIVFDLGGVVFNWQPDIIINSVFDDSDTRKLVKTEIIEHADWVALDRGTIEFDLAVARGASRTGLPQNRVRELLSKVPRFLTPIQGTIDLIHSIQDTDNRFFVLSNMHVASIAYLEKNHAIWHMFEGAVISSRIQLVKPEIEIYEYLLNEFGLNASDTVFIDDMQENLAAASTLGIQTIQFQNSDQCRRELVRLGCIQIPG